MQSRGSKNQVPYSCQPYELQVGSYNVEHKMFLSVPSRCQVSARCVFDKESILEFVQINKRTKSP